MPALQMRFPVAPVPGLARPRVGAGLIGAAVVLALWASLLGLVLPVDLFAQDWSVAWTGLADWQLTWSASMHSRCSAWP